VYDIPYGMPNTVFKEIFTLASPGLKSATREKIRGTNIYTNEGFVT